MQRVCNRIEMNKATKLIVLSLILVMLCSIAFVACDDKEVKPGFYRLQEAYDLGLIDKQDLQNIAHYQHEEFDSIVDEEGFVPTPKDPETLTDEQTQELLTAFTQARKEGLKNEPDDMEYFVEKYYGTYNGHIVAMFRRRGYGTLAKEDERVIEGVYFYFPGVPMVIYVWVE